MARRDPSAPPLEGGDTNDFDFARAAKKYVSVAKLKAQDMSAVKDEDRAIVLGVNSIDDGGGGLFYYDADSSATEETNEVIAPDSGGGRWFRLVTFTDECESISELVSNDGWYDDHQIKVNGFYSRGDGGGGTFYWDASEDKANHNGGTIINPDHNSTIGSANWYSATGDSTDTSGSGCWKRELEDVINIDYFGANTTGDNSEAIEKAWKVAASDGLNIKHGKYNTYSLNRKISATFTNGTEINLNHSVISIDTKVDTDRYIYIGISDGLLRIQNGSIKANNNTPQPLRIDSTTDTSPENVDIDLDGFYIEKVYKETGQTNSATMCEVTGGGYNLSLKNIRANSLDCDVGEQPTTGFKIGNQGQSFENISIENCFGVDITEQGGGSSDDSDFIKIDGWDNTDTPTKRTSVYTNNVKVRNASGKSIKRVIKINDADEWDINNTRVYIESANLYSIIACQSGHGSVDNTYIEGTSASFPSRLLTLAGNGQTNKEEGGPISVNGFYIEGSGNDFSGGNSLFSLKDTDSTHEPNRIWDIKNVVLRTDTTNLWSLVEIEPTSSNTIYNFKNFNISSDASIDRGFCLSRDTANEFHCHATFENIHLPSVTEIHGSFSSEIQNYLVADKVINSDLKLDSGDVGTEEDSRFAPSKYPEMVSARYLYSHSSGQNNPVGDTVFSFPASLDSIDNRVGARLDITVVRGQGEGGNWSKVEFIAAYRYSTDDWVVVLSSSTDETATTVIGSPSLSWDATNNVLTLTWGTTDSNGFYMSTIDVKGNVYYEVDKVFGISTY